MERLSPTLANERINSIDVIRGFALLGIFFVNMLAFSAPWLYLEPGQLWNSKLDVATETFIDIFAQASFYTLFSFLFGFGMILFMERAKQKGASFVPLFSRRLVILLVIGIIHAFLIWHGDILITYALVGFILLLFHKTDAQTMLIWAILLILVPSLLLGGLYLYVELQNPLAFAGYDLTMVNQSIEVYSTGSYLDITKQRINDWYYVNNPFGYIFLTLVILPMFLLGAFVAKKRWFHEPVKYAKEIKKVWLISLSVAVVFKLLPYYAGKYQGFFYIQDTIGGPASAIFYATSIVILFQKPFWQKLLTPLSYVGRLSLSNYLFQSIVATLFFYSYGLGLYGQVRAFYTFLLAIGIYIIQIYLSKWWLSKYRIGPAEWLWRSLTYKKVQRLKKEQVE